MRHQGAHELDTLLHAVGKAADGRTLIFAEPGIGERRTRFFAPPVARHKTDRLQHAANASVAAVLPDHHVIQRAQMRHQPNVLKAAGDAVADAAPRRNIRDVDTVESNPTRYRR